MYLGYPTKKALCKAHNVSYCKFITGLTKKGMSIDNALSYAATNEAKSITYNGLVGIKAIAASLGLSYNQLRYTVSDKGLSVEDAITYINSDNRNQKDTLCRAFKKTRKPVELSPLWALALGIKL